MEDEDECSAHETSVGVNESKEPPKNKMRKLKSSIWRHFKKIGRDKERVEKAMCRGCKKPYRISSTPGPNGKNYGTSHLKRHLTKCKKKVYFREKEKLKQALVKIPNRVCLNSDCWTASTSEEYLCLTAQYIDDNWKVVSKILNFFRMIPPHTGVESAATIYDCFKEWGVDRKVFSIT
uniref:BED-type domain-containing protein n=1 Tax=Solanum lycopersicum TaxID=4081 RepID=A0A3Q7FIQ1_SOLLC